MRLILEATLAAAACAAIVLMCPSNASSFPSSLPTRKMQIAAFHEVVSAVNAGDAARYARVYAEDAVITILGGGQLKGRSAIQKYEVDLLQQFPGTRLAFYDIWLTGSQAVVRYGVNGHTASRQAMGHEGLLFYRFDPSGLIEDERRYNDSLTPMAQLGILGKVPARIPPILPAAPNVHEARGSRAEEQNVATVKASLAALHSKNESAFLSGVADDAVVDELMLPQPFVGKENLKRWFEDWTAAFPDAAFQITNVIGVGNFVLLEGEVRGTLQCPFGLLSASGNRFSVHRAAVFQVRAGKLIHSSYFMNGKELAEASGQWPLPVRE
jgi:ketosteroid isomerase-like protein